MLAIFGKSVSTCPDKVKGPNELSNSALKDGFLAGYFAFIYQQSVVADIDPSVVFAYSVKKEDHLRRTMFGVVGDVFCMYQGEMKDVDSLKKRYCPNDSCNEIDIIFEIFKILREVRQEAPKRALLDLLGNFSFVLYDRLSKCVMLTSDCSEKFQLFWGVDSEQSLIISDEAGFVSKACFSTTKNFPKASGIRSGSSNWTDEENWKPFSSSWQPPPSPDVFKVNTEELVFSEENMIGIGVTIRNSTGQICMALSKKIKGFKRCIHAEELAIVEGLRMAHMNGIRHVLCETTCFKSGWIQPHGAYYVLLRSVRTALLAAFSSSNVLVINRDANKAAHGLAKYAKEIEDCVVWHRETPPCILDIVLMDSNPRSPRADI